MLSPGSAIPSPRAQAFLEVRPSLEPVCERFHVMQASMNRLDELGDRDDVIGDEITGTTAGFAKVAGTITPVMCRN